MHAEIELSKQILSEFQTGVQSAKNVDRPHIVAHALLSAYTEHWPSRADPATTKLLEQTQLIRKTELSRWIVQRRIALVRLAHFLKKT